MGGNDFIDLLSSDEEAMPAPCAPKPAPKPAAMPALKSTTTRAEHPPNKDFLYLSDDFDSAVHLDESYTTTQPTKRRKIGPSLKPANNTTNRTDDGFPVLNDDDPTIFTSSVHHDATALESRWKANTVDDIDILSQDSDDSLPEDILGSPWQTSNGHLDKENLSCDKAAVTSGSGKGSFTLSDTTKALLASLTAGSGNARQRSEVPVKTFAKASGNVTKLDSAPRARDTSNIHEQEETRQTQSGKPEKRYRLTEEEKAQRIEEKEREKEAKAREKERVKERKAREKEEELQRRRLEKEEKAMKKQKDTEIAEVNRAKLDKKDSTPEMIVDLPVSIHSQKIDTQTREFLKNLDVETSLYQSSIPNVIKWRRKVKAKWNIEEGLWEPLPRMQIEEEKHIICIMPAEEFISLATAHEDKEDVDNHVAKLRSAYPDCVPIYLIEGLTKRIRESKTAANRKYQNEVLGQAQTDRASSSQTNKRKKAAAPIIVDEDVIEDALLRIQVIHDCLIHHTAFYVETAEWIATFTQHISTIPYK